MTSTGRSRYREPNMAHPRPSTNPTDTMAWERRTWIERVTSLSNFTEHVLGDIPSLDNQQPAPSTYMTLMYNRHYTLSATHYHAATNNWLVHGTNSLLPANYSPPGHNQGHDTYTKEYEPDDPNIWVTSRHRSLDMLLSICSRNQGVGKAMYCLAKWTQRTCQISAEQWAWKVSLRP